MEYHEELVTVDTLMEYHEEFVRVNMRSRSCGRIVHTSGVFVGHTRESLENLYSADETNG